MSEIAKTVIVGGSTGIGANLARLLRGRGVAVHIIARNEERLKAFADEIGATWAAADATQPENLTAAITAAGTTLKGLVYAVGTITLKPIMRLTEADIERDFRINALGAFNAVRAAIPGLRQFDPPAAIVLFSTIAVSQGFANHASIAMAKGAVEGLTLSLAAELAPSIRVNCIAPSLTQTPLAAALTGNSQIAAGIAALHPLQRLGEPKDAAALAAFLLSPDAGWITGQIIGVDGGRSTLRTKG